MVGFFKGQSISRFDHRRTLLFLGLVAISVLCEGTIAFAFQGRTEIIAREGDVSPDGGGTFGSLYDPVLSESGIVSFNVDFAGGGRGVVRNSSGTGEVLVRSGQSAPDGNGSFSYFRSPWIGSSGQVGYFGFLTGTAGGDPVDNSGLFTSNGSTTIQVVRAGQIAPDGNGTFSSFTPAAFSPIFPEFNEFGEAAFARTLLGTTGGTSDNSGVFRGNGTSLVQIARKGQIAPGSTLAFDAFGTPTINSSGQTAFSAALAGGTNSGIYGSSAGVSPTLTRIVQSGQVGPGGIVLQNFSRIELNNSGLVAFNGSSSSGADRGIYVGSGDALTQIARLGQSAPGGGTLSSMGTFDPALALNENGQVAFHAGTATGKGLFRGNGLTLIQIAREGNFVPGGNGRYSSFAVSFERADFALNDSGQIAFHASLTDTSAGTSDNSGIFTSDGIDSVAVVRKGSALAGSTIASLRLRGDGGAFIDGQDTLNNMGQIAYTATLVDGRDVVNLWTPNLRWRSSSDGNWDTSSSWTLGLKPAFVHDVSIDPATNMTVTGPSSASTLLRNLDVGGGAGEAILALQAGTTIGVSNRVLVRTRGTLEASLGNSTINGSVRNADGTILVVNGSTFTIQGNLLQTGDLTIGLVGTTASRTIVTGFYSGNGFSGGGELEVRGDFQLDDLTLSTTYGGNLFLGPTSETHIEMSGPAAGEFDQMIVGGNLNLSGDLNVFFEGAPFLAENQQFLIADVAGTRIGMFNGLGEGALVGTYSGRQLFITYAAGDGNDIALMTVPEPGSGLSLALVSGFLLYCRNRQRSGTW